MDEFSEETHAVFKEYANKVWNKAHGAAVTAELLLNIKLIAVTLCAIAFLIGIIAWTLQPSYFHILVFAPSLIPNLIGRRRYEKLELEMTRNSLEVYRQNLYNGLYRNALREVFHHLSSNDKYSFVEALNRTGLKIRSPREASLLLLNEHEREAYSFLS